MRVCVCACVLCGARFACLCNFCMLNMEAPLNWCRHGFVLPIVVSTRHAFTYILACTHVRQSGINGGEQQRPARAIWHTGKTTTRLYGVVHCMITAECANAHNQTGEPVRCVTAVCGHYCAQFSAGFRSGLNIVPLCYAYFLKASFGSELYNIQPLIISLKRWLQIYKM